LPIALYTKLDAECDQQMTVVGRLSTALGRSTGANYCQKYTDDCHLFSYLSHLATVDVAWSNPQFGTKFQMKYLYLWRTLISLKNIV